jgi:hypothetical protein
MTEPRDDEAGREALVERFALALVSNPAWYENAVKASHADGPRLAEQVWARAHDIVYARPAPIAATAPSEASDEAVTAPSSTSDACGQIALATFMARTEAQGREARTRFFADLRAPNAPRDEAAALLREAREVLERYAVGWTDDGRSFDNVAVIAMRARIDAYLRRAGPEGGGDGAVALTKEQVDRVGRKIDTPEARRDRAEFDASHGAPREGDAERGRAGK